MEAKWVKNASLALALMLVTAACGDAGEPSGETDDGATSTQAESGSDQLVIASLGGSYQDAQSEAFFMPFEESAGVEVIEANHDGTVGELKAQVEAGNVEWDVVDLGPVDAYQAAGEDLLEALDQDKIDAAQLFEGAMSEHAVATIYSSNVITWNTDVLSESMTGIADFWDLSGFPGGRALPGYSPYGVLEHALVADGVPAEDLYPLDVERALAKLDEIKSDTEFFNTNEQGMQLVTSGQVAAASVPNGRVFNAEQSGEPIDFTWNDGTLYIDYWAVPKGAQNVGLAMDFIAFASEAEQQAELAEVIPYGGSNPAANDLLSEERQQQLPTGGDNLSVQIEPDLEWWTENLAEVTERWQAWLVEG